MFEILIIGRGASGACARDVARVEGRRARRPHVGAALSYLDRAAVVIRPLVDSRHAVGTILVRTAMVPQVAAAAWLPGFCLNDRPSRTNVALAVRYGYATGSDCQPVLAGRTAYRPWCLSATLSSARDLGPNLRRRGDARGSMAGARQRGCPMPPPVQSLFKWVLAKVAKHSGDDEEPVGCPWGERMVQTGFS